MQFKVAIIEALPNELMKGQEGFEKLANLLTEEAKNGWSLKQVDSSWAQGYMIYTVILQKPEPGDETAPPPAPQHLATEPPSKVSSQTTQGISTDSKVQAVSNPDVNRMTSSSSEKLSDSAVVPVKTRDVPRAVTWLASAVGLGVGVFLVFLGLITAISASDSIALGQSRSNGLLFPGVVFTVGLIAMIFSAYKIGELAWRQGGI